MLCPSHLFLDTLCRYGLEVDVYAFGVLMWEVASLKASSGCHCLLPCSARVLGCAPVCNFPCRYLMQAWMPQKSSGSSPFLPLAAVPLSFSSLHTCSMVGHEGLRLELIGSASMPVSFTDLFRDCTDAFPASRPSAAALFSRLQRMRNQHFL